MSRSYNDLLTNAESNRTAYDFWRRKTQERIPDKQKADILAPEEPPHPFGAKRPSLEQNYYEQISRDNVELVDLKKTTIEEFTENGILTSDGTHHEVDMVAMATGFDAVTGGLKKIAITGLGGQLLNDKWEYGTHTYLGITTVGFPNFFFTYGPQSPTAFANGPSCIEPQCDWIANMLTTMRDSGYKGINAKQEGETEWKNTVNKISEMTLVHGVDSWYVL
jgi:cation diffusion facilitator CzcD-associated flavoprotein CzcO